MTRNYPLDFTKTPSFLLHVNVVHVLGNSLVLWLTRPAAEVDGARGVYPFVFLGSAIAGGSFQLNRDILDYPLDYSVGASGATHSLTLFGLIMWLRQPKQVSTRHGLIALLCLVIGVFEEYSTWLKYGYPNKIHLGGYSAGLVLGLLLIRSSLLGSRIRWQQQISRVGDFCGYLMLGVAGILVATHTAYSL